MLLIPAHAKVNLCLAVRGRRPDGFHDIDSVVVTVDWHDLVGIDMRAADQTTVRLRVCGESPAPAGDANLAARAARAVAAVAGPLAAEIWLDKRVPSAAGLGGGSADAAAVLRGCASLAAGGQLGDGRRRLLDAATLAQLASSLGSDVPVLLAGGAQRVRGRGELLEPLPAGQLHLAVAVAGESSTAASFAALHGSDVEDGARPVAVAAALQAGARPDDDLLGSGLEAAARRANPALDRRLAALRAALPQVRWHLTGSGGAVFAITGGADEARALALAARRVGFAARACRTVSA
jgi:4-diphosphocytidyl-2-C-methyl-D-erythritol kinase